MEIQDTIEGCCLLAEAETCNTMWGVRVNSFPGNCTDDPRMLQICLLCKLQYHILYHISKNWMF